MPGHCSATSGSGYSTPRQSPSVPGTPPSVPPDPGPPVHDWRGFVRARLVFSSSHRSWLHVVCFEGFLTDVHGACQRPRYRRPRRRIGQRAGGRTECPSCRHRRRPPHFVDQLPLLLIPLPFRAVKRHWRGRSRRRRTRNYCGGTDNGNATGPHHAACGAGPRLASHALLSTDARLLGDV
ncbi:hypothetical protein MRX96_045334 [Rhipicephalus microplus]